MRKFFIKTTQSGGEAPLYTRIRKKSPYVDFWINTHISVNVTAWRKAYEDLQLYAKTTRCKDVEHLAQDIDRAIDDALTRDFTRESVQEVVDDIVFREERELRRQREEEALRQLQEEQEAARIAKAKADADVRAYLANLIRGMKDGSVRIEGRGRNQGERYTPNTIKMWNTLAGIIERFYQVRPFTWEDIDKRFAVRFRVWLEKEGYMKKSANKYMSQFVALINRALRDGKHGNREAVNFFARPAVEEDEKATEIYLTADELNALYQMHLKGEKALVRDIFIVGCCTCQRVSDYTRIGKENFVTTARGTRVVKIRQQKTRNFVTIPILDDKLTSIMERYDYRLPKLPTNFDVVLNRYIKEICKELSETVPSLAEELPTILTMKEREMEERGEACWPRDEYNRPLKHRYELVTSHTARRTGITHLYLSGKFDVFQMMHVSGHKEAKTFRDYIKLSGDEMAEEIAEKMGSNNLF